MIIWSAVVTGCGIIALLGIHAAIYRFGTDEFTGNILFAVFFILLVGLYFSVQPVFEAIFKRLFSQRTSAIVVAETSSGEQVAIPVNDEQLEAMQFSASTLPSKCSEYDVCEEDVEFAESSEPKEFEVIVNLDELRQIRFLMALKHTLANGCLMRE